MSVDFDVRGQQGMDSLEETLYGLWTHILAGSDGLKLKHINEGFVYYKHAAFAFIRH